MPKSFWASVRSISQSVGYTIRGKGTVKVPSIEEIRTAFIKLSLDPKAINEENNLTELGKNLIQYYEYRAEALNNFVQPRLMDVIDHGDSKTSPKKTSTTKKNAKIEFERLIKKLQPKCPLPMNKQKGIKKAPAYFTAIINMLIDAHSKGHICDYDPRELTTITKEGQPLRTMSRRVDGAFPSAVNPIAIWEIKEYYYTTTFGSRVADGVYESLLDGMELEELNEHEDIKVLHYLMIDSHYTWWCMGKPYLCRIIDMLNMGYVDEVMFGYEVIERLPTLVNEWIDLI
jgi:hypothetical protein